MKKLCHGGIVITGMVHKHKMWINWSRCLTSENKDVPESWNVDSAGCGVEVQRYRTAVITIKAFPGSESICVRADWATWSLSNSRLNNDNNKNPPHIPLLWAKCPKKMCLSVLVSFDCASLSFQHGMTPQREQASWCKKKIKKKVLPPLTGTADRSCAVWGFMLRAVQSMNSSQRDQWERWQIALRHSSQGDDSQKGLELICNFNAKRSQYNELVRREGKICTALQRLCDLYFYNITLSSWKTVKKFRQVHRLHMYQCYKNTEPVKVQDV